MIRNKSKLKTEEFTELEQDLMDIFGEDYGITITVTNTESDENEVEIEAVVVKGKRENYQSRVKSKNVEVAKRQIIKELRDKNFKRQEKLVDKKRKNRRKNKRDEELKLMRELEENIDLVEETEETEETE